MEQTGPEINPPSSLAAMHRLETPEKTGLDTSEGVMFNHGIWGRDRIITALDVIDHNPEIAEQTIKTLASLQGTEVDKFSEEEPGKIHTESRNFDTWNAPASIKLPFRSVVSPLWGGNFHKLTTYFSADSTPLYVRLVSDYCEKKSTSILGEKVKGKDGKETLIFDTFQNSLNWLSENIDEDGLVTVPKSNIFSLFYQTWRDGLRSNPDEEGKIPNVSQPISYLDIQFLTVDAFEGAAKTLRIIDSKKAETYRQKAAEIRKATLDKFWMEDEQFFGMAIDIDSKGEKRLLRTIQSNPGWMLNTKFFDGMSDDQKQKYLEPIIKRMFSEEFLTDAGVRARSTKHKDDMEVADYHGTWVSWPVDSYMFAKGLRKQGFPKLAEQIENRLINTVNMSGVNYEFYVVDSEGKVILNPEKAKTPTGDSLPLKIEMTPEKSIAWTVTATLRAKRERGRRFHDKEKTQTDDGWKSLLEEDILKNIRQVPVYKNSQEMVENYPESPNLYFDQSGAGLNTAKTVAAEVAKQRINQIRKKLK